MGSNGGFVRALGLLAVNAVCAGFCYDPAEPSPKVNKIRKTDSREITILPIIIHPFHGGNENLDIVYDKPGGFGLSLKDPVGEDPMFPMRVGGGNRAGSGSWAKAAGVHGNTRSLGWGSGLH